jgi:hypothetical protein
VSLSVLIEGKNYFVVVLQEEKVGVGDYGGDYSWDASD